MRHHCPGLPTDVSIQQPGDPLALRSDHILFAAGEATQQRVGKELLLLRGSSFRASFSYHVLVLSFEEAKLWRQRQGSKGTKARRASEGYAGQAGRWWDQEMQRITWRSAE